jgi:gamma-glutamyl-gamma-aminobutyrate hydrolase PuuD
VALGGSLYRDRSEYPSAARAHPGGDWERWNRVCAATVGHGEAPAHPEHPIAIAPDSLLAEALGRNAVVNSYHHQALRSLGRGVQAVASAPDGIVEAIEVSSAPAPCIGVQWELQESWQSDERFLKVFQIVLAGD